MQLTDKKIVKKPRKFYPESFDITNWENVEKELRILEDFPVNSAEDLLEFLQRVGEMSDISDEEQAWRYINMTRFADDEKYSEKFNSFYSDVVAKSRPYTFKYNKKFYDSPYRKELSDEKYGLLNKIISNEIELFREENIPLQVKVREIANKYGSEYSKLTVNYKGEEKTLSQLGIYLKDQDRSVREEVWNLRTDAIAKVKNEFNEFFDEMKTHRIQIAENADFDNYRDYMHASKGRFSYTPKDLYEFHDAVEEVALPFLKELNEKRKKVLGLEAVKPWDSSVDLDGKILKPFEEISDFTDKGIKILNKVKHDFGVKLNMMKNSGLLDLENRKGKAPGGYNYPLQETGAPFIFMNAVGLHRDLVTLVHEAGHAMHTFATTEINIDAYKSTPSEIAELASMAMEFITMDYWNEFYPDAADFAKAKREQLEGAISFLPWAMTVDAFQHWIYTNPNHTVLERDEFFVSLMDRFDSGTDWSGLSDKKKNVWLFQLHIFEVPFYYIEYAMSQLGALAVYRNYKKAGKEKTLENYENFLKLGYSVPVDKLYEAAGIKFDFSKEYLAELMEFVKEELAELEQ
jgi:oligoendopeptidase F